MYLGILPFEGYRCGVSEDPPLKTITSTIKRRNQLRERVFILLTWLESLRISICWEICCLLATQLMMALCMSACSWFQLLYLWSTAFTQ